MTSWAQPFGDKRLGPFYMWPVAYSITKIFYLPIRVVYNTKKTNYDTYRQTGTEMGERMKNRDNEFFIEEELDELVREENKEALKDQLSRILACSCCLNGFKHCRKYLQIFTEEEIVQTPYLATAAAVISAIYGDLERAEHYAACVECEPIMKLHLDVMIPGTDMEKVMRALEKLANLQRTQGFLPNLPLAAGRLTLVNGFRDFTMYGTWIREQKEQLKQYMRQFYGDSAVGMAEIAYAEICYQRNECFEAITTLVGCIPFIEREGEIAVLFIALSLQMKIMIATGQIAVVYPMLDKIYQRLYAGKSRWLLENYGAMKVHGLMYDGDVQTVSDWMEQEAPNELGELCMLDTYKYMIKMRAYILEERYLAMLSLAEYLRESLRKGGRTMDLCEMDLLCAVSYFLDGKPEEAYSLLDHILPVIQERRFDRLVADEGEKVYFLLRNYRKERQKDDEYLNQLIQLSKKMALLYPDYLRKAKEDYPSLTETEKEILCLLADERSNMEIADFMEISINTVKFHIKNIYTKLKVKTRQQAGRTAKENKLISIR